MAIFKDDSYYDDVDATSEWSSETVVPNGETWKVYRIILSAAPQDDCTVRVAFDGVTIRSTHSEVDYEVGHNVVGDGVKKLSIVLTNDTAAEIALGASWEAKVL